MLEVEAVEWIKKVIQETLDYLVEQVEQVEVEMEVEQKLLLITHKTEHLKEVGVVAEEDMLELEAMEQAAMVALES